MAGSRRILNKRMLLMLLGCLLLFGGIFAFKLFGRVMMNRAFDTMPMPPATVTSAEVASQVWRLRLAAVGSLRAVHGVEVTTQAQGVVRKIYFRSGQQTNQGDLLVELSADPETAQLGVLEAELRLAEREHERLRRLFKQGVATEAELDDAIRNLDRALADIVVQRATIQERRILAPFSGWLGIRQVDLGQNVNPGDAVVSLQQLHPIYVDFSLPEQEFARVGVTLAIAVTTSAFAGEVFPGRITAIDPQVDSASRNFLLQGTIDNPDGRLRPGMFADVSILLPGERRVLVVPRTAISYAPFGNTVFVLEREQPGDALLARQRIVKTGEERGDLVEIVEGLQEGETVASSGLLKLRNNAPVRINDAITPPENLHPQPENR
ncbi:efflux RND transporter periplasmic adaptor subunit [Microbulbifer discodermiae]|uniref:efflux RND transporter periplasmic adaptor subunit n=1 Tax=Microbulbifer sp. 2201CG32-9 TaxID=3232309 RepID=UPI00345C0424